MGNASASGATHDVVLTRRFDAPLERVWKAWTDSEAVMQWWGPTGFTAPLARMDVREGGTSLVCMRAPAEFGGQDMYNTWTYRRVEPPRRLEYILNFADQDGTTLDPASVGIPPGVPRDVRHVIAFEAAGDGQTDVTVMEYGYATEEARDLSAAGMAQCLDKMAELFARSA